MLGEEAFSEHKNISQMIDVAIWQAEGMCPCSSKGQTKCADHAGKFQPPAVFSSLLRKRRPTHVFVTIVHQCLLPQKPVCQELLALSIHVGELTAHTRRKTKGKPPVSSQGYMASRTAHRAARAASKPPGERAAQGRWAHGSAPWGRGRPRADGHMGTRAHGSVPWGSPSHQSKHSFLSVAEQQTELPVPSWSQLEGWARQSWEPKAPAESPRGGRAPARGPS